MTKIALNLLVCLCLAGASQRQTGPDVRLHEFASKFLTEPRTVIVWLPPGYAADQTTRYPVLYLHDGQNVYIEWKIDEIAKPLIASKQIEPLLIVMVSNGGTSRHRFDDYTWTRPANAPYGGKGNAYAKMLVEELKPFIDKNYRTLPDAANTGVGGASLGGIMSLYLGLKYPDVFGKLAVMSPAVWWDNKVTVREVSRIKTRPASRIWLDVGAAEPAGTKANVRDLRGALVGKGWTLKSDLFYFELPRGEHDERFFAMRAGDLLEFLFPAK